MELLKKDLFILLKISPFLLIYGFIYNHFFGTICFVNGTFGIPCPGCGLTHAGVALFQGNIRQSLQYHMLFIPAILYIMYALYSYYIKLNKKIFLTITIIFGLIFLGYYIYRILYLFPGELPMQINKNALFQRIHN